MIKIFRQILCLLASLVLISIAHRVYAHDLVPLTDPDQVSSPDRLREIIKTKMEYYNKTYPEIRFVQVNGGNDWHADMVAIMTMLGTDPDALDYQHPPQLREMLMDVTLKR